MSDEKKLFDSILEYALPSKGDRLFMQDGADKDCLQVDPLGMTGTDGKRVSEAGRWELYADGFKRTADAMVEKAISEPATDNLLYPILARYRHFLELRLKSLLAKTSTLSDKQILLDSLKHHKILDYWTRLKPLLAKVGQSLNGSQVSSAEKCIREFADWDDDGQSTRYPWDVSGNPSFEGLTYVNVRNLKATMEKLEHFLFLLDEAVGQEQDWRADQAYD
jgi:hypothetical protein